jgi:hypothetical protein
MSSRLTMPPWSCWSTRVVVISRAGVGIWSMVAVKQEEFWRGERDEERLLLLLLRRSHWNNHLLATKGLTLRACVRISSTTGEVKWSEVSEVSEWVGEVSQSEWVSEQNMNVNLLDSHWRRATGASTFKWMWRTRGWDEYAFKRWKIWSIPSSSFVNLTALAPFLSSCISFSFVSVHVSSCTFMSAHVSSCSSWWYVVLFVICGLWYAIFD